MANVLASLTYNGQNSGSVLLESGQNPFRISESLTTKPSLLLHNCINFDKIEYFNGWTFLSVAKVELVKVELLKTYLTWGHKLDHKEK